MKDQRLNIRIQEELYKKIQEKAESLKMSVSDYMTFASVNAVINVSVGKELRDDTLEGDFAFLIKNKERCLITESEFEKLKAEKIKRYCGGEK